jgi:tetratricopeptide (TPR) repeat protein
MKTLTIALSSLLAAGGVAGYVSLRNAGAARAEEQAALAAESAAQLARVAKQLDAMSDRFEAVESRIHGIENTPKVERDAVVDAPSTDTATKSPVSNAKGATPQVDHGREIDDAVAKLVDPLTNDADTEALWRELVEKGLVDQAIAKLKERAEADPNNPDLQVDLAAGYLQKLFSAKNPMEQGGWAMKMDTCYDKALTVDPQHWDARFSKAVSYSFWPAITGKPQESVKQFEMLVEQQEKSAVKKPQYAETYVLLGNLYKQQGKLEEAKAAYEKGLTQFPDHESLKAQIGSL